MNSSDKDPTWEIDRLLDIRHDADHGIVAKVRWATYGQGDDSWEPISGLPKHLVIRLAEQKNFMLPDDAFPTTPVVLARARGNPIGSASRSSSTLTRLAPCSSMSAGSPRQLATRRLSLPFGHPPSSRSSPMTHHLPTGHWDAPHARDSMRPGAPIRSTCSPPPQQPSCPGSCPLPPRTPPRGCAAAFSVDWAVENGWASPPFSFLPQVVARVTSYSCDLTLVAPRWQHQSWWALATRYCAARVQLNPPYPTFTVAG